MFLKKDISERILLETIKEKCFWETSSQLYLCAAGLDEKYRGRGIGYKAMKKHIQGIEKQYNKKYELFAWIYSAQGERLVNKLEKELKRTIHKRL